MVSSLEAWLGGKTCDDIFVHYAKVQTIRDDIKDRACVYTFGSVTEQKGLQSLVGEYMRAVKLCILSRV